MKTFFAIIGGVVAVIFLIGIGSCGKMISDSENSGKKAALHISEVRLGMTKSEVISILGKPEDAQHFESSFAGDSSTEDCIYYGTFSDNNWQLCFTDGILDSKNTY